MWVFVGPGGSRRRAVLAQAVSLATLGLSVMIGIRSISGTLLKCADLYF